MKKLFLLTFLLTIFSTSLAFGATVTFTGDNEITYFSVNGTVLVDEGTNTFAAAGGTGNLSSWTSIKAFTFDYNPAEGLDIDWKILNYALGGSDEGTSTLPENNNPMGFIATLDLGDGQVFYSNLSDGLWTVGSETSGVEYAYGTSVWNDRPGDVFSDSNWLSAAMYGTECCFVSSGPSEMSVSLAIAPTPIPGAAWLLGSGLVGLVGLRRKFRA